MLSATRQDKLSDYLGRLVAISGLSFPDFWLGTLIITFAAIWFGWMPPLGYTSVWESPWRNLQQFLLPAAVLGLRLSAATMRMTRSTLLEVLREDYVRTAWAKGLGERLIIYKHALKNALIPVVTIVGGQLGTLLAGTVIVETIFALPGMGRLTVEAILFRDYPVVQTNVMLVAGTLVTLNLTRGSDLRLVGSTYSVPIKASMPEESDVNSNDRRLDQPHPEGCTQRRRRRRGPFWNMMKRKPLGVAAASHYPAHRARSDFCGCAGTL